MTRRYPLEPLMAVTGWSMAKVREQAPCNGSEYRLRISQGVTERTADRLAVAAGLHPFDVWPEIELLGTRPCAAAGCQVHFAPKDRQSRYCSPRCRQREKMRRYRARPHGAEVNRRLRREHYAACIHYERASNRARYRARTQVAA